MYRIDYRIPGGGWLVAKVLPDTATIVEAAGVAQAEANRRRARTALVRVYPGGLTPLVSFAPEPNPEPAA